MLHFLSEGVKKQAPLFCTTIGNGSSITDNRFSRSVDAVELWKKTFLKVATLTRSHDTLSSVESAFDSLLELLKKIN